MLVGEIRRWRRAHRPALAGQADRTDGTVLEHAVARRNVNVQHYARCGAAYRQFACFRDQQTERLTGADGSTDHHIHPGNGSGGGSGDRKGTTHWGGSGVAGYQRPHVCVRGEPPLQARDIVAVIFGAGHLDCSTFELQLWLCGARVSGVVEQGAKIRRAVRPRVPA